MKRKEYLMLRRLQACTMEVYYIESLIYMGFVLSFMKNILLASYLLSIYLFLYFFNFLI